MRKAVDTGTALLVWWLVLMMAREMAWRWLA
jgi:hypothetical protein